jgi:alpha-beta hydrolase superfamily lysophospholipase
MTDQNTQKSASRSSQLVGPRLKRFLKIAGLSVLILLVVVYAGIGWYVSGEIISGGLRTSPYVVEYDTAVVSIGDDEITIRVPDEESVPSDVDAVMGLRWEGGYGQVGPATAVDGDLETRPFSLTQGNPPAVGDDIADFDSFAFPNDPSVLGVDYEVVTYATPLGDVDAWLFPGSNDTWIVAVHGNAADRTEYLRLVDSISGLGYPVLVIRYRNDPESPATGDSLILMGQEEHEDVVAAVDYALDNGAADVIVYGTSLGGAVTLGYALEETRDVVRGLILEAPVTDLREAVRLRSGEALPIGGPIGDSFLAAGRLVASLRTGLDFDTVDYVERAAELDMPILLFHGVDDPKVPLAISQNLAAERPDLVEFHAIPDAAHVRAWNEDPASYAGTVTAFLDRVQANR